MAGTLGGSRSAERPPSGRFGLPPAAGRRRAPPPRNWRVVERLPPDPAGCAPPPPLPASEVGGKPCCCVCPAPPRTRSPASASVCGVERRGFKVRDGITMIDGGKFDGPKAYKDAKVCNMLTIFEMHRRFHESKNITFNTMYPGRARKLGVMLPTRVGWGGAPRLRKSLLEALRINPPPPTEEPAKKKKPLELVELLRPGAVAGRAQPG